MAAFLEDADRGDRLGEVVGDFTPFLLTLDGAPHVVIAGRGLNQAQHVDVLFPHVDRACRIGNGVWMTFPEPFEEGARVTAVWRNEAGDVLQRVESPPLRADALGPVFGPGWVGYAPLDSR